MLHRPIERAQYTSVTLTERLRLEDIAASIGSVGDAYDNALAESVNGLYKTECIRTTIFHSGPYRTISDVEFATAGWVDWYNNSRLHSSIGQIPPTEFETLHYSGLGPRTSPQWRRHKTSGRSVPVREAPARNPQHIAVESPIPSSVVRTQFVYHERPCRVMPYADPYLLTGWSGSSGTDACQIPMGPSACLLRWSQGAPEAVDVTRPPACSAQQHR